MRKPWITVSAIKGLLSADDHCEYAAWFKAHNYRYRKIESTFDFDAWRVEHDAHVKRIADQLKEAGWKVTIEDQNDISIKGESATVKAKLDILAEPPPVTDGNSLKRLYAGSGQPIKVIDVKTGKPSSRDLWQVKSYLSLLPLAFPLLVDRQIVGEIHYPGKEPGVVEVVLGHKEDRLVWQQIKRSAQPKAPPTTPSRRECRFCDIADCDDRDQSEEVVGSAGGKF